MSQNLSSTRTLPPLNVGSVVSVGVTLYRSHLKSYITIALIAYLWYLPGVLLLLPVQGAIITTAAGGPFPPNLWLLIPVAIALLIYGGAKYCFNAALIARLAFQELIHQPEGVEAGRNQLKRHPWGFFWIALRVGLRLTGLYLLIGIPVFFVANIIGIFVGGQPATVVITNVIAFLLIIAVLIWFISHWFIAELPLAAAEVDRIGESIDRSWKLTGSAVLRVQGVVLITFLVTLPLLIISNYLPGFFINQLEPGSTIFWILNVVSTLLSFGVGIITMPFWQAVKAVLYYDLRNRQEGLGLQLSDRTP